jgi:hypothetical protein
MAVEDIDHPAGTDLPQMVIGPAIAEADFQHWSGQVAEESDRGIETGALRLQATNETVETTQGKNILPPRTNRSRGMIDRWARLFVVVGNRVT